jgi:hypothetical protein
MVFGLDPQGLEAFPHDQPHDDDDDGHAAHASHAFLWEDWWRVVGGRCPTPPQPTSHPTHKASESRDAPAETHILPQALFHAVTPRPRRAAWR